MKQNIWEKKQFEEACKQVFKHLGIVNSVLQDDVSHALEAILIYFMC